MKRPKFTSKKISKLSGLDKTGILDTSVIYYKGIEIGSITGTTANFHCSNKAPGRYWPDKDITPGMRNGIEEINVTFTTIKANTHTQAVKWVKNNSEWVYDYFPLRVKLNK